MNFAGNIPYNTVGLSWPSFGYEKNDRWQFSTDLAWVRGTSTIKVGFEYRHHKFPHKGWAVGGAAGNFNFNRLGTGGYDAAGNNLSQTGDPFASFLLGQVHDVQPEHLCPAHLVRGLRVAVDQRRVQGQQQAHADRGTAPRLPDRAHRGRTTSTRPSIRTRPTPAPAAGPGP